MNKPTESSPAGHPTPIVHGTDGDGLVCAFNDLRAELVSTLFFYLGNHEDAQDVAQDAFLKCWRAREGLGTVLNLRAWIFRIGLNAARDLQRNAWRRRARSLSGANHMAGPDASPADQLTSREERERLRQAIMGLRTEEKEVYLLRQNGGLTYEEIAVVREAPVGTVKTQMRAALAKLRQVLKEKVEEA
jgi:RNA polymerase sigma-70 factor, ECF subfamily